jgi:hypothetical protein
MWTNEQLSYLAGIIDGEGSICVDLQRANGKQRKHDYYCLRLSIVNTNKELMEWLVNTFEGNFYAQTKYEGKKQCYTYRLFGDKLLNVVISCLPYFIIKKPQAELVQEFRKTVLGKTNWNIPKEVLDLRYQMYLKSKQLNKTGDHK